MMLTMIIIIRLALTETEITKHCFQKAADQAAQIYTLFKRAGSFFEEENVLFDIVAFKELMSARLS